MIALRLTLLLASTLGAAPGSHEPGAVNALGIEPLRTPFRAVEERLGPAPLARRPAEGEVAPVVRCYFAGGWFLLVESAAAGGYGDGLTTGIELTSAPPTELRPASGPDGPPPADTGGVALCAEAAAVREVRLPRGLALGAPRGDVVAALGRPTEAGAEIVRYVRDDRGDAAPRDRSAPAPAWRETVLWFTNGRLTGVRFRQSDMI